MDIFSKKSGIRFSGDRLKPLMPVLEKWIELVQRYSDTLRDSKYSDACYWYNERASVSVLAAAAWSTSPAWIALEEYSTRKHDHENGERLAKNGRCDLYCANPSKAVSYAIEAKQAWQNIGKRVSDPFAEVSEKFKDSKDDAMLLDKQEAATRVGACFVIPRFPANELDASSNSFLGVQDWLRRMQNDPRINKQYDAIAWVFPYNDEEQFPISDSGKLYPGVCLLLKARMKSRKRVSVG